MLERKRLISEYVLLLFANTPTPLSILMSIILTVRSEMGCEIVTLYVGPNEVMFNVHKNLIVATSGLFADFFQAPLAPGQKHHLKEDEVDAFKLFTEYMYSKRIPAVDDMFMEPSDMARRIKGLCQFYAFADKYYLKFEIRNRIMDHIQDGFREMKKLPEPGLVRGMSFTSSCFGLF